MWAWQFVFCMHELICIKDDYTVIWIAECPQGTRIRGQKHHCQEKGKNIYTLTLSLGAL